jgi:hypothetical protein
MEPSVANASDFIAEFLDISVELYKNIIRTLLNDETLVLNKEALTHILEPLGDAAIETGTIITRDINIEGCGGALNRLHTSLKYL